LGHAAFPLKSRNYGNYLQSRSGLKKPGGAKVVSVKVARRFISFKSAAEGTFRGRLN
jgi:hypothetical protein